MVCQTCVRKKKALYQNFIVFQKEVMPKIALVFHIIDGLGCHNFQVEKVLALIHDVGGEVLRRCFDHNCESTHFACVQSCSRATSVAVTKPGHSDAHLKSVFFQWRACHSALRQRTSLQRFKKTGNADDSCVPLGAGSQ